VLCAVAKVKTYGADFSSLTVFAFGVVFGEVAVARYGGLTGTRHVFGAVSAAALLEWHSGQTHATIVAIGVLGAVSASFNLKGGMPGFD